MANRVLRYDFLNNPKLTDHDTSVVPGFVSTTPDLSLTRATIAKERDADGWLREFQASEARMRGATFRNNILIESEQFDLWAIKLCAVTADQIANPLTGAVTADLITGNSASTTPYVGQTITGKIGGTYVFSVYAKAHGTGQWLGITESLNLSAYFDLVNGVVGAAGSNTVDKGMEDVGDGWYRCWIAFTATVAPVAMRCYIAEGDGDITWSPAPGTGVGFYVYGAQLEEASGRWDSENRMLQSNDLDTSPWVPVRATVAQAVITDPDGGTDAWAISEDNTAANTHYTAQLQSSLTPGQPYMITAVLKAGNRNIVAVNPSSFVGGGAATYFDLSDGTIGTDNSSLSGVEDLGDGWYKCWMVHTPKSNDVDGQIIFYACEADNDITFDGLSQISFYAYKVQYERTKPAQTTPGTYVATTAAAVTNYSPSDYTATTTVAVTELSGASTRGYLIEESRTNLCLQSEDFSTAWGTLGADVVNTNQTLAPDGSLTADQIIDDEATGDSAGVGRGQAVTISTSTTYTYSCFVKADQLSWVFMAIASMGALAPNCYFDVGSGAVGTASGDTSNSGIEDYGNGWYRCWFSFLSDATDGTISCRITCADADGDNSVTRDGTSSIFCWGAQLEAGSKPSAYIRTTTGTATRNADDSLTADTSWWANGVGGSFYSRSSIPVLAGDIASIFDLSDGTVNEEVNHRHRGDSGDAADVRTVNGAGIGSPLAAGAFTADTVVECAARLLVDDCVLYADGVQGTTDTDTGSDMPTVTDFYIGRRFNSTTYLNGYIEAIDFYDDGLTEHQLYEASIGNDPLAVDPTPELTAYWDFTVASRGLAAVTGPTPGITRATTAVDDDADGWLREYQIGESRHPGAAFRHNLLAYSEDITNAYWGESGVTRTANTAVAPDGTTTADTFEADSNGNTVLFKTVGITVRSGQVFTYSVYLKNVDAAYAVVSVWQGTGNNGANVWVDMSDGSIGTTDDTGTGWTYFDSSSESVGNGWYRISVTGSYTGGSMFPSIRMVASDGAYDYSSNLGKSFYVWGHQLEDVSGRWDSENSLYDSDLNTWRETRTTIVTAQSDPLGGTDAIGIAGDNSTNTHYIDRLSGSYNSGRQRFSVYAKAGSANWVQLADFNIDAGGGGAFFDLENGAVGSFIGSTIDSGIEDAGGGWYRCWLDYEATSDVNGLPRITTAFADGVASGTVGDGSTIETYLFRPQTERTKPNQVGPGTFTAVSATLGGGVVNYSPSDYIATTTAAASDLSGTALGLRQEAAKTNICLQSEDLSTTWSAHTSVTIGSNATIAPDGSLTADKLGDNAGGGADQVRVSQTLTTTVGTAYTFSVFAKADQLAFLYMDCVGMAAQTLNASFNLSDGSTGTPGASVTSVGTEDYGNGWYRCWFTFTTDGTDTSAVYRIMVSDALGDATVDIDGTSSIFCWGAQLEAGPGPSTYIPTTTGTATRNLEDIFSSDVTWYDDDRGTLYAEGYKNVALEANRYMASIHQGVNDYVAIGTNFDGSAGEFRNHVTTGNDGKVSGGTMVLDTLHKIAGTYQVDEVTIYFDGVKSGTDTTATLQTSPIEIVFGSDANGGNDWNGIISKVAYWNGVWDEASLLALTADGTFPSAGGGRTLTRSLARDLTRGLTRAKADS